VTVELLLMRAPLMARRNRPLPDGNRL